MSGATAVRPSAARAWEPPPWLWVTLALFVVQVPALIGHVFAVAEGLGPLGAAGRGRFVTAVLSLVQLLPLFFLLAAVLALLFPAVRCRAIERRHGLLPPDHPLVAPAPGPPPAPSGWPTEQEAGPTPSGWPTEQEAGPTPSGSPTEPEARPTPSATHFHQEMQAFLDEHAPGVRLRISTRSGLSARVYPGGRRATRIGVFAPLVHLWDTDAAAARAVLLHEVGHLRRGEQHVAGLGSPFTALVRVWPYVLAVFVVVPVALLLVTGNATATLTLAEVVLVLFSVPKVLLLVVAALWSAELDADRWAVHAAGPDALVRALRRLEQGDHGGLARLHHPPVRLRVWCATREESGAVQLLSALLWPSALLAQLLLAALGAVPAYELLGASRERATREALGLAHHALIADPAWWVTLAVVLLWPLVRRVRVAPGGRIAATSARVHAAAVLFPATVLLVGLLPLVSRPSGGVFADDTDERRPAPTGAPSGRSGGAGGTPTACPSPSAPAAPPRPRGLPSFTDGPSPAPGSTVSLPADVTRTFHAVAVTSLEPLSGTRAQQAAAFGDRMRQAHWTLHDDGRLTADVPEVPALRSTGVRDATRWLTGRRTDHSDVSTTATWVEARLLVARDGTPIRLDLVRAASQSLRAVVDCQEFTTTSSTAVRLSLTLGQE
ncbi:M48 family metalloprotease [Streptomyces siamensis]